jgi:hypothetical protein
MLGLGVGHSASQPGQNDRLGVSIREAYSPAIGTLGGPLTMFLTTAYEFSFGQHPRDFIADLASQLFQID